MIRSLSNRIFQPCERPRRGVRAGRVEAARRDPEHAVLDREPAAEGVLDCSRQGVPQMQRAGNLRVERYGY